MSDKKGLLAVSFGTSFAETRKKTIGAIEETLKGVFPDRTLYAAWTSGMIRKKLKEKTGENILSVGEALEQMKVDGVTDVLVQPTHLLEGEEHAMIGEALEKVRGDFASVRCGRPLLADKADVAALAHALEETYPDLQKDECFVFMGHGSEHMKLPVYTMLEEQFAADGHPEFVVGTVEFEPGFAPVLAHIQQVKPKKVYLAPLLVVAGDHATNDMAGDDEDSWKSQIRAAGYTVECILKGLGEYEKVRALYAAHAQAAAEA